MDSRAAVYSDGSFGGEITGLKVTNVKFIPSSRIISAPVESGVESFDNKVIEPAKVIVTGSIMMGMEGASAAISTIKLMLANRKFEFYSVSNGEDCYDNLILESCPSTRDSEKYDLIVYELTFKQALLIQGDGGASGDNSNFQNNGFTSGS